jgi:hypothetical protein
LPPGTSTPSSTLETLTPSASSRRRHVLALW